MIRQYLSNTNESAIVSISQKFSELNKALLHSRAQVSKRLQCVKDEVNVVCKTQKNAGNLTVTTTTHNAAR